MKEPDKVIASTGGQRFYNLIDIINVMLNAIFLYEIYYTSIYFCFMVLRT